jgi:hypothetical protein
MEFECLNPVMANEAKSMTAEQNRFVNVTSLKHDIKLIKFRLKQ